MNCQRAAQSDVQICREDATGNLGRGKLGAGCCRSVDVDSVSTAIAIDASLGALLAARSRSQPESMDNTCGPRLAKSGPDLRRTSPSQRIDLRISLGRSSDSRVWNPLRLLI